ncbi:MAG TPA: ribbon-helix-helix domain-containing protein [Phycisphaerae bacterium]|jgi:hypothetical protein
MSKADLLQQALKNTSNKVLERPVAPAPAAAEPALPVTRKRSSSKEGKEHIGAWMNPDFNVSLRMVQLRQRKDANGNKIRLGDLIAEALNDLFRKYDVPTVHHE